MKLYEETIKGNTDFINETLDINHALLAFMYNKNKEDVLSVIVTISYYRCLQFYYIRKKDTSSFGRADITFTPRDNLHIPFVIELKVDDTAEAAIDQIKNKNYIDLFIGYKGKVLLLGVSYDSKT